MCVCVCVCVCVSTCVTVCFCSLCVLTSVSLCVRVPERLVGLVVKASASRTEDPGFESRLRQDFSWSSHTSDSKTGSLVASLSGAWYCRVSAGTGRPCVSIL